MGIVGKLNSSALVWYDMHDTRILVVEIEFFFFWMWCIYLFNNERVCGVLSEVFPSGGKG